jgi:hypothetical protein
LQGRDITGWAAHRLVRAGLALVPEGRMVAAPLTVQENIQQTRYAKRLSPDEFARRHDQAMALFPVLAKRSPQIAGSLSGNSHLQDRLLFASDFPYLPLGASVRRFEEMFDDRVLVVLFGGNARPAGQLTRRVHR